MTKPAYALALAVLLAAGCLSRAPEAPGATPGNATASTPIVVNDDGSSAAQAVDTGSLPHLHDYWKGKERVTLFDGDLQPDAENTTFATLFQVFFGRGVYAGGMLWNLPDGKTVFEGTGIMEITASWSDPRVTGIGFIYQSAENREWKDGGSLPSGKAVQVQVSPSMTDMPHAKTSKWLFGFGPDKSPGALMGPFHLKVDVVRVRDIALFPAHPDFWQGKHDLVLLDADHHGAQVSYAKRSVKLATEGTFSEDEVALAKPVPMETQAVRFTVTVTAATSTPGKVTHLGLFYRGADMSFSTYRCEEIPLKETLPATLTWIVPSTMEMSDSPYENASAWRFLVEPQVSLTGADPPAGGMTDTDITYHVVATAFDSDVGAKACQVNGF